MLSLEQIENQYPPQLRGFKKNILREYIQYIILEIIFNSKFSNKLAFLGGTALRIIYNNSRFSEDLDFDNFGMTENDFNELAGVVENGLNKHGFDCEVANTFKGAYRCKIKLPNILFDNQLSDLENEKLLIQIDTAPHKFAYEPDKKILNKFDVFTNILSTPADIILSQKFYAILNRKRAKGRDYYDIVFLLSFTKPNYEYLKEKINAANSKELKTIILEHVKNIDFKSLVRDVEPFLFNPEESKKIEMFPEYIKQVDLD